MRNRSAKSAYQRHKSDATRVRGIQFDFTFEDWCAWWEKQLGPDWMTKRGCRRGQYVMARLGDRGPYAVDNVKCILCTDNHKEKRLNNTSTQGERHPNSKLTEAQVLIIRASKKSHDELAFEFGVSKPTVSQIQNGRRWAHLRSN